jgi:hypothetical protein
MNSLFEGLSDEERKELAKPLVNVPPKVEDPWLEGIPIQEPTDQSPPPYPDNEDDVDTWIETYPAEESSGIIILTSDYPDGFVDDLAHGHAWQKHVMAPGGDLEREFRTPEEFAEVLKDIVKDPDDSKRLDRGRMAWWSDS